MFLTPLAHIGHASDGNLIVSFRCSAGVGAAKWCVPTNNHLIETFAELDITPTLQLGRNVELNPLEEMYSIDFSTAKTIIVGTVESIDEDGMAYLRLTEDCLIMAESVLGELTEGMRVKITLAHEELVVVG